MTAINGDLLFTEVLKKEKNNSLRDLSWQRIQIGMSFIYFLLHHCVYLVFFFTLFSIRVFFEHNHAQPISADRGPIITILLIC